jgi:hypothetical protein
MTAISLKASKSKIKIKSIHVGPVWTTVVLKLRTGLLTYQGKRTNPRRPIKASK